MFEQYRSALSERFPGLNIDGANYDPQLWRVQLSTILLYGKMAFIFIIAFGYNPFPGLGTQTPRFFQWAVSNKVSIVFFYTASRGSNRPMKVLSFCRNVRDIVPVELVILLDLRISLFCPGRYDLSPGVVLLLP